MYDVCRYPKNPEGSTRVIVGSENMRYAIYRTLSGLELAICSGEARADSSRPHWRSYHNGVDSCNTCYTTTPKQTRSENQTEPRIEPSTSSVTSSEIQSTRKCTGASQGSHAQCDTPPAILRVVGCGQLPCNKQNHKWNSLAYSVIVAEVWQKIIIRIYLQTQNSYH